MKTSSMEWGFLFLVVMDWIIRKLVGQGKNGFRWKFTSKLDDLDVADDTVVFYSTRKRNRIYIMSKIDDEAKRVGIKINIKRQK